MKRRNWIYLVSAIGILLVVAFLVLIISFFVWRESLPRWELSATNTPAGLRIEVYKEDESSPTYVTVLKQHSTSRDVDRANIEGFPTDLGRTTFTDESFKPGRWTVIIDGVELDIQPARMVLDGKTELTPLH